MGGSISYFSNFFYYLMNTMKNRDIVTYAFVDAANIIYRDSDPHPWKIDLKKLLKYLSERFGAVKIFYYGGIDHQNKTQVHLYHTMEYWGYELRLNRVKRFINERGEPYLKADVDSRLTFDMMRLFHEYDRAVVLTGDGDFYWVLEYLLRHKEKVWLLASPRKTAKELKQLFGYRFSSLDDTRRLLELGILKQQKEADPTNVSASGITKEL